MHLEENIFGVIFLTPLNKEAKKKMTELISSKVNLVTLNAIHVLVFIKGI